MPGGHTLFGTRSGAVALPAHRSAGFTGNQGAGPFLFNPNSGGAFSVVAGFTPWVALWVKADQVQPGNYYTIFRVGSDTTAANNAYGLQINGATQQFEMFASNGTTFSGLQSGAAVVPGKWYLLLLGYGGSANQMQVYDLMGLLALGGSTGSLGSQVGNLPLFVGGSPGAGNMPFVGEIDSLAFWPRGIPGDVLTPSGVNNPYWHGGRALDYADLAAVDPSNLAAFYNFNDRSGAALWVDSSPAGNTLAATGMVFSHPGAGWG